MDYIFIDEAGEYSKEDIEELINKARPISLPWT